MNMNEYTYYVFNLNAVHLRIIMVLLISNSYMTIVSNYLMV